MINHVFTTFMAKIKRTFLVTIEIDTEKAKPFPEGFKDPAKNGGDNGMNWNTYPNWELNYQGCETKFIDSLWTEFRIPFKYDGLECGIFAVNSAQYSSYSSTTLDDMLYEGERLLETVWEEIYPYTIDPESEDKRIYFATFDEIVDQLSDNIESLRKIVDEEDFWRKNNHWYDP